METNLPCYMELMPDELLSLILEYLNTFDSVIASHVCQRWRRVASSVTLFVRRPSDAHRASISHRQIFISARGAHLNTVLNTTRNVRTLIVHERVRFDTAMLTALQGFPHLAHLDIFTETSRLTPEVIPVAKRLHTFVINDLVIKNTVVQALAQSSCLTQLHMFGYSQYYPTFTMVKLIASRQQHLTQLTLRCTALRNFQEISCCHNLVALRLYSCHRLTGEMAVSLMLDLPNLTILHLTSTTRLYSKDLHHMISVLPKGLKELSLSGSNFDDEHASPLVERLPYLRVLELWLTLISVEGLLGLALSLQKLQEFDIDKLFTINQLRKLEGHPTLKKLRCSKPRNIWNREFQNVAGHLAPVPPPQAQYASTAFRSDGLGFRSILFYHWSLENPPRPLSYGALHQTVISDYDDDYSLLGPDILSCSADLRRSYEDAGLENDISFT